MYRCLFTFLVLQNGKLDETMEAEISFDSHEAFIAALIAHAAQQSRVATAREVVEIWSGGALSSMLSRAPRGGFGPSTGLIIKSAVPI